MKKIYEKPEIESVSYAANTSLCGSCDTPEEDLETIALLFDLDENFFTSRKGAGYFQNQNDGCQASIDIVAPGFTDMFDYLCKFTSGFHLFIS